MYFDPVAEGEAAVEPSQSAPPMDKRFASFIFFKDTVDLTDEQTEAQRER